MKKKITKLTLQQEQQLKETYSEWLSIGRSVEPINIEAAKEVVVEFYRRIGKSAPLFLVFSSPPMCILAWGILKKILSGAQLRDQLWDQLWDQLRDQLRDQLEDQLGDQLRDQLRAQLRDQLWDQLGEQLRAQLWDQLRDQLEDQLGNQLRDQLCNYFAGAHWCNIEVFYKFGQQIGCEYTQEQTRLLDLWIQQSRHLHWWFPYEGVVLLSQRPTILQVDDSGRLHNESGLACGYSDGWGIWAWHGRRVPQFVIEKPEEITIEHIRKEENAEIRRVMIERMGWNRFCSQAKMRIIHSDRLQTNFPALPVSEIVHSDMRAITTYRSGEEIAELLESEEFKDFDNRSLKFVRLTDPSTGERYLLRVWPENTRAYEAVGQTFGMTESQYKNSIYLRQGDVGIVPLSPIANLQQQHS